MAIDEADPSSLTENSEIDLEPSPYDLTHAVGAWVYIAIFAGIALGWSTALFAPWIGGAIGGCVAFVAGILVVAFHG